MAGAALLVWEQVVGQAQKVNGANVSKQRNYSANQWIDYDRPPTTSAILRSGSALGSSSKTALSKAQQVFLTLCELLDSLQLSDDRPQGRE
jgi:hypothetical protein